MSEDNFHEIDEPKPPRIGVLIAALILSMTLPVLVVVFAISAKNFGGKAEVQSMESAIRSVGTEITEKDDCDVGVQGFYEYKKAGNKVVTDQVVICTNNFSKSLDNYPALLKHEMTHIMQACLGTTINSPDEIRELRKDLRIRNESSHRAIHGLYAEKDHFEEVEARWMELQEYKYVNSELQKHCGRGGGW